MCDDGDQGGQVLDVDVRCVSFRARGGSHDLSIQNAIEFGRKYLNDNQSEEDDWTDSVHLLLVT